jgi:serine/threonine protein kinase
MEKRATNRVLAYSVVGTPYYMAPEVLMGGGYTHAGTEEQSGEDVWCVTCACVCTYSGSLECRMSHIRDDLRCAAVHWRRSGGGVRRHTRL